MIGKATNKRVTKDFLLSRISEQYGKQKWISFCESLLEEGYEVYLYEARKTFSKYITVKKGDKSFKVRFSNHKPIYHREVNKDCDFFVGVTNLGVTTTANALEAVREYMGETYDF